VTSYGRILVVEQPGPFADIICQRLETLGHKIVGVVASTAAAAETAPRLLPDLVVVGAQVAGESSAVQLTRALRERLDCPCLTVEEAGVHAALPAAEQLLQLRLELALREAELARERERADSAEQVSRATARAIHEINNLLSAIRCNAFLIQSEPVSHAVLEAANDITAAVERSAALVQDVSGVLREQRLATKSAPVPPGRAGLTPRAQLGSWPPWLNSQEMSTRAMYIVLVVDDDPVVRRAVARFVASAGYQVIESSSPEQGLAAAERYPVDLMITDLVMPSMTGYELAQRIANIRPGVRVIYMSGFTPHELAAERGRSSGHDPIFLQKPFAVDALMPSVFAMLAEDKTRGPNFSDLTNNKQ
jgi:CheY-like chemotaxis protein